MNKQQRQLKRIILDLEELIEDIMYGGDKIENIDKALELLKQVYIYGDTLSK